VSGFDVGSAGMDSGARDAAPMDAHGSLDGAASMDAGHEDAAPGMDGGMAHHDAAAMDAMMATDAGGPIVEIGTGTTAFVSLSNGEKLTFNAGPQGGGRYGGYNIWGGVRASDVMPAGVTLVFSLTSSSGRTLGTANRMDTLRADGSGHFVDYGLSIVLDDCCAAVGRAIVFRLDLTDASGVMRSDERQVLGADECPPSPSNPLMNPCP
jgi:hypothetical protein